MNFFITLRQRTDSLLPPRWQYISAALFGVVLYAAFAVSQGDSAMMTALESCAGAAVGLIVVAALRRLGATR
ncbi:hypothetical protein C7M71_028520 [Peterkaempfera bronchialis]|uniref:Uncharacterized protein n=1 Tax=Peterkaempfera bronchialis TaxID=2126346 RepID=A0A345T436_9ACTN|nr:hypothetical protein C7M71_028520 [Peterkaempfera bronchialis]